MPDAKPYVFKGLTHHFDEAAKDKKAPVARAKLLEPVKAFSNHITTAVGHAHRGDAASLSAADRSLDHAEAEISTLEVAVAASKATLADARALVKSKGGTQMAKPKDDTLDMGEGDNFRRDPAAPPVSGEPHPDPSQSNIGAQRAGKENPADVEAENEETAEVQDEQEAAEKKAAKASKSPKKSS